MHWQDINCPIIHVPRPNLTKTGYDGAIDPTCWKTYGTTSSSAVIRTSFMNAGRNTVPSRPRAGACRRWDANLTLLIRRAIQIQLAHGAMALSVRRMYPLVRLTHEKARSADERAAFHFPWLIRELHPRTEREHTPNGGETPWTDPYAPAMPDEKASTRPRDDSRLLVPPPNHNRASRASRASHPCRASRQN